MAIGEDGPRAHQMHGLGTVHGSSDGSQILQHQSINHIAQGARFGQEELSRHGDAALAVLRAVGSRALREQATADVQVFGNARIARRHGGMSAAASAACCPAAPPLPAPSLARSRWEDGELVKKELTEPSRWDVHSAEEVAVTLGDVRLRIIQQVCPSLCPSAR